MDPVLTIVTGVTILTVIGIMSGGTFLLRIATKGLPFNALQKTFFRAGHAHAGVLVILGLLCILLQADVGVPAEWQRAGVGVLVSALLIPGGFFLSVLGPDPQRPNRAIALLWAGVVVLAASLVVVGVSVIVAGAAALA
ncbi:hypothetical protein [Microbacterium ulmi]|uniref:Uncharacterized protein n=1 Tax=Microbacterium ulmi TaxID=179095 RepID=A0A7Y2Q2D9_9MICO|nr:hypothetical protein [Microbacterium ulmi]NII70226.1 hypothetical protein [Microbacterium ulmi]NNH04513.1 hypothetical protein [Microbacterium ulmi]